MKTFLPLLLIVLFEVAGNSCLSHGMHGVGDVSGANSSSLWGTALHVLTNPWVLIGVVLLIGYFLSFLAALSRLDLSYVLPMTAFGYVMTALVAWRFLGETISAGRWLGIGLIGAGTVLVGLSERRDRDRGRDR